MIDIVDELIEDALRELADESRQRHLWLASNGDEISSFTECVERLWTDSGLAHELERRDVVYTHAIDDDLRKLDAFLHGIDASRADEEIIDDPHFQRARLMARKLLRDVREFGLERDD
jgi:hypothetical protein